LAPGRPSLREPWAIKIYQDLLLLAESIGVRRRWNPEAPKSGPPLPQVEDLLSSIDHGLNLRTVFPNPFPGESGLVTSRGIISDRAVQALYQAWRVFSSVNGEYKAHIVEIGAGLGRTAFYAKRIGLPNYIIVDIPMTNVAQAYFLGRTLGSDAVCLFGEKRPGIQILPSFAFFEAKDRYDIVLNADSLTELDPKIANAYGEAIRSRADVFLSMNHETNSFTVQEICRAVGMSNVSRTPYWMRLDMSKRSFGTPSCRYYQ